MSNDALAYLMSAGVPSASFLEIGTVHAGQIESYEKTQQRDLDTNEPKVWPDGQPMWQIVFTIQTDERDDQIDGDDGLRKIYAKAQMLNAIREAVKTSGHAGDLVGGKLAVKYVRQEQPKKRGYSGPKVYAAKFEPPVQTADLGAPEPDEPDYGETFG